MVPADIHLPQWFILGHQAFSAEVLHMFPSTDSVVTPGRGMGWTAGGRNIFNFRRRISQNLLLKILNVNSFLLQR